MLLSFFFRTFACENDMRMKSSDFLNKFKSKLLWGNLLAMFVVAILLCIGAAWWLNSYTYHGMGIVVPDLTKMNISRAQKLLEEQGLQVIVNDSGYNRQLPGDCILAQSPVAGSKVKTGRAVYVTVNSSSSPTIALPDVVDNCSEREAEARLSAMGFQLTEPKRIHGEKEWVYGIISRGRHVATGDRVSTDYPLTLVVGDGMYDVGDSAIDYVDGVPETPAESEIDDFEVVNEP